MTEPIEIILVIALLAYTLVRRSAGQPAQGRKLLVAPLVFIVIGLFVLSHSWTSFGIVVVVASGLISVVFGIVRGFTIKLYDKDGVVWMKYTKVTIALWIANIVIKLAGAAIIAGFDPAAASQESSGLILRLGLGVLMEGIVVASRGARSDSRVMWIRGEDDRTVTSSTFLDRHQQRRADRAARIDRRRASRR
jgi:membrane protein CcdC involved in cytochrome C biogenesis